MKRLVVLTLLTVFVLGVAASGVLAADRSCTQDQTQARQQSQAGDCVCECADPNCDGDCPQNCCQNQNQSGNSYQAEGPEEDWIMFLFRYFFQGGR